MSWCLGDDSHHFPYPNISKPPHPPQRGNPNMNQSTTNQGSSFCFQCHPSTRGSCSSSRVWGMYRCFSNTLPDYDQKSNNIEDKAHVFSMPHFPCKEALDTNTILLNYLRKLLLSKPSIKSVSSFKIGPEMPRSPNTNNIKTKEHT